MRLGDATWNEVGTLVDNGIEADGVRSPILLIPVGSTEQHGPHLPIATDTLVAEEIVARAIHRTDGLMVGPTLAITSSGEHAGFPGTLSIGSDVMAQVVLELGRSADWAAGVVFVNGHGGNYSAVSKAVATLCNEDRSAMAWWPKWPSRADGGPADLHAGRIETSLLLAIDPGLVRLELAVPGADADIAALRSDGVKAVSPSGVLGDPTGASGREGERFVTTFVDDLVNEIEAWRPIDPTPAG
ncbi:MAG: mycofactocin biosynthesis peptidyl-dipeptidase MftE [Ilumatobacter sp.]|nr:mycofactocin biosynthesis peptidyl-dipeptidase MftE [Ilumatobacter sp.]